MFKPIIHNLKKGVAGFEMLQEYNKLIGEKPTNGRNLDDKIKSQREWRLKCLTLLDQIKEFHQ